MNGYQIGELLYESDRSLISRGIRDEDKAKVVLKRLNADQIHSGDLARFRMEYAITKELDLDGVVKACALESSGNQAMIVFNDIGGDSLAHHLKERGGKLPVDSFLPLAISLARIVESVHKKHYIHKDINPTNIIWAPATGQVELIDFGISTELSRETQAVQNPRVIEGTLPYMSPEQTGRMNRAIDYRTDLYSLGVTLYQMLTGRLPFETDDPMEMVYCHIARTPVHPHEIDSDIPEPLASIVMKLLSKMAEDRYKSAAGLVADLSRCLEELQNSNSIPWFEIGKEEGAEQFRIPQKFYGRELEIDTLMKGFSRTSQGGLEMILVAGYSGIGKSSLVKEIYKPIVRERGFFISGKFDQYQHDVPYAPIIEAFTKLIQYLLTESEEQLATWRFKLLNALGDEGQILVDIIPDLELIIGSQPSVLKLHGVEMQKRFRKVFLQFLNAFCTKEHPLTLFLDDLQWVDPASLGLLETVMSHAADVGYLLLLGAYRDNEVSPSHPLRLTLDEIRQRGATDAEIKTMTLGPLSLQDTDSLVADTVEGDEEYAAPLAVLVQQKTAGNPFFIIQLLTTLYETGMLEFSHEQNRWVWDAAVNDIEISNNVADLLAKKIKMLPEETLELLGLASCMGTQFDLVTLSTISSYSKSEIATGLWSAVLEELIVPQDVACSYYRWSSDDADGVMPEVGRYIFSHDRVQEAAYSLLSNEKRSRIHLETGRLLLANAKGGLTNDILFEIVNHMNYSVELVEERDERIELALLNLRAGNNAKRSTAYNAAREYYSQGIELLGEEGWKTHLDSLFLLYRNGIECEFLNSNPEKAESMFNHAVERAPGRRYKGELYELMIRVYQNDYAYDKGIELGKRALELFDISIPEDPDAYGESCAVIQAEIAQHTGTEEAFQKLVDGPAMTDKDSLVCCGILHELWVCLFMAENPQMLFPAIKLIQLSITDGQSSVTAVGYIFYALIQTMQKDYDAAYTFGRLAMALKDKHTGPLMAPKVLNTYCNFVNHYKHHIDTNVALYEQSHKYCVQSGEIWWGAWAASFIRNAQFIKGDPLEEVRAVGEKYADYIREAEFEPLVQIMNAQMAKITNLMGETGTRTSLDTPTYSDRETEETLAAMPFGMGLFWHNVSKTFVFFLYGEKELAMEASLNAEKYRIHDPGLMQFPDHFFFSTLVFADNWDVFTMEEQAGYAELIDRNIEQMDIWQRHCPENYQHRYLLMRAEKERLAGDELSAMSHYDQAIAAARENRFFHHEAVANERAGLFHHAKGREQVAERYFLEARFLYLQWGANRKVEIFDEQHPELAKSIRDFSTTI